MRFVYGLDPASKQDSFGIVVHELPLDSSIPKLRAINKLTDVSFDKIYNYLVQNMFHRYPPFYVVADYTNEKTFSDLLVQRYGKDLIELINFSNANKLQLKQDGLSILKQGYKFPSPLRMAESSPKAAKYVQELVHQLQAEQMLATKTDKVTFDHPAGRHNDLAIAWELSIHGCLRFMKTAGPPVILSGSRDLEGWRFERQELLDLMGIANENGLTPAEEKEAKVKANVTKRLRSLIEGAPGMEVTDVKIDLPSNDNE